MRDIVSLIEHGHEPVMRGLMIDISEAKRTEEALRLSEQKFASVFQQCPDILVIARLSDGCLLEVNEAFEEQIGLSAGRSHRPHRHRAEHLGHSRQSAQVCCNACRPAASATWKCRFRRSNGQLFTGLISAEPFDLDTTPALVVVVRDISQLKETQQQLQISEEKFAKAFHASPMAC